VIHWIICLEADAVIDVTSLVRDIMLDFCCMRNCDDGDGHEQRRYRIVKEAEDEEGRNDDDDNGYRNNSNKDGNGSNDIVDNKVGSIESSRNDGRSRGAHVRIEESDGGRNEKIAFPSEKEVAAPSRPRIYLEDDDPEFDDFDEEDPDDDLDI